jgi:hypothetical protein
MTPESARLGSLFTALPRAALSKLPRTAGGAGLGDALPMLVQLRTEVDSIDEAIALMRGTPPRKVTVEAVSSGQRGLLQPHANLAWPTSWFRLRKNQPWPLTTKWLRLYWDHNRLTLFSAAIELEPSLILWVE